MALVQSDIESVFFSRNHEDVHEDIKASLLLESRLPDLLSRAPLAAELMGLLRMLAYSEALTLVKIKPTTFAT